MSDVVMYTSAYCPYCRRAKALFDSKGVAVEEIFVDRNPELRQQMMVACGRNTVPQIWIGETHVGGCDDLLDLDRNNGLDSLLNTTV
ncbi:glutaredoxin 3 [Sinobacterium caligoides]|uniref:Glutaredoxin n=1 Tax=Sinobacterium caligoides TaxID=933926 RepID=A0A3N2DGF0_9GAMM|nr:glutaredoxin 3 [Sinobacterium caligoides]ROR98873.1 glutaredoxin 3 [Sinobacterium caligoides]